MGSNNRSAVATMVDRTSRFVILAKLDAPTANAALESMTSELSRMAPALLKAMTHDQGSEMARHAQLTACMGMNIYFADRIPLGNESATRTPTDYYANTCPKALIYRRSPKRV